METIALGVAAMAMVVALVAMARVSAMAARLEEAELASRRRSENLAGEFEEAMTAQRNLLAQVVAGDAPSPEMIREGRLWRDVDGAEALRLVDAGARVLDVRTKAETASGVIPGALHVSIEGADGLERHLDELPKDGRGWLVYCAAGGRSAAACEMLARAGHSRVNNLAGGIGAWSRSLARPG